MLSEISQRKTNTIGYHLYVESEKVKLTETETRMVVTGGSGREHKVGKWGDVNQGVQTSSHMIISRDLMHSTGITVNNTVSYT